MKPARTKPEHERCGTRQEPRRCPRAEAGDGESYPNANSAQPSNTLQPEKLCWTEAFTSAEPRYTFGNAHKNHRRFVLSRCRPVLEKESRNMAAQPTAPLRACNGSPFSRSRRRPRYPSGGRYRIQNVKPGPRPRTPTPRRLPRIRLLDPCRPAAAHDAASRVRPLPSSRVNDR